MAREFSKQFYKSKEWINFRKIIILERGATCEECNKVITESKHIQVHHIKELDPSNIHDTSITLNPNNVKILCQECHNKEHNRWCKGSSVKKKDKGVYIVYGPPGAGKTTYVLDNMERGDIVVDMDRLYEAVTLLPRYDKPNNLKYNVLSIRNGIIDNIKTRYGKFNSAWIIGGYADKYQREQLARDVGAETILVLEPKEVCLSRIESANDYRQECFKEWEGYIDKWFNNYTE